MIRLLLWLLLAASAAAQPRTLVQISDPHVGCRTGAAHLELVLQRIASLRPRPRLVIATGDLTEKGRPREFDRYFEIVTAFERRTGVAVLSTAGNHDVRWNADGRRLLREHGAAAPALRVVGDLGVLAVDSTLSFGQHGRVAPARLRGPAAPDDDLGGVRDLIVAMHHPPGREPHLPGELALLAPVLGRRVSLVLCGHGHRHLLWTFGGVPVAMAVGVMNAAFGWRTIRVTDDAIELSHTTIRGANATTVSDGLFPRADRGQVDRYSPRRQRVSVVGSRVHADADHLALRRFPASPALAEASRGPTGEAVVGLAGTELPPGLHDLVADLLDGGPPLPVTVEVPGPGVTVRDLGTTLSTRPLAHSDRGLVVVASEDGGVYGLDAATLASRWRTPIAAGSFVPPLDLGADGLAVCDGTPAVVELSWGGEIRARHALPALATAVAPRPGGDFVLALSDGELVAWRPGAAPRALAALPAMTRARPLVAGDRLLVATWDRRLHVLDASGASRGDLLLHRSFYHSAATADPLDLDGRALLFGHDQRLLLVDPQGPTLLQPIHLRDVSPAYGGGTLTADGSLLLASMTGSLCIVDRGPWRLRHAIPVGGPIFDSTPCTDGARAWVGTMTGDLVETTLDPPAVRRRVHLGGYVVADPLLSAGSAARKGRPRFADASHDPSRSARAECTAGASATNRHASRCGIGRSRIPTAAHESRAQRLTAAAVYAVSTAGRVARLEAGPGAPTSASDRHHPRLRAPARGTSSGR